MKKIYLYKPSDKDAPFLLFLETLDDKARKKLEYALKSMAINTGRHTEPQVKHFSIERFRELYELREKARVLLRVIFVYDSTGNAILLHPFIKRHKRNTSQALESSLGVLEQIRQNPDLLMEYSFHTGESKDQEEVKSQ